MFRTPIGTRDVLPAESARRWALNAEFQRIATLYGFGALSTPMFEAAGVFDRLGGDTDVVSKEMYRFTDQGDREMVLRPEGTAAVCRAFVQASPSVLPWKVTYGGPFFRYEAPQAGRFRQFQQLGAEVLGTDDPAADVETIAFAAAVLTAAGLSNTRLLVNSMGDQDTRSRYVETLREFLEGVINQLVPEDQPKVASNPLRVLDSKRPATIAAVTGAPVITDQLSPASRDRFNLVLTKLDRLGISYTVEPRLVRGLDYYTDTTFEFKALSLDAAQDTVCGGGRYNGLVEALGGKPTGGVGFALGVERLLLACDAEGTFQVPPPAPQVWVVDVTDDSSAAADVAAELRAARISADRAFDSRSMRAQLKAANRSGAQVAVIVGDDELVADEVTVRALRTDDRAEDQQRRVPRATLVNEVRNLLNVAPKTGAEQ